MLFARGRLSSRSVFTFTDRLNRNTGRAFKKKKEHHQRSTKSKHHLDFNEDWLVVLDDVCSASLSNVTELLLTSRAAFIITTRSSVGKSFLETLPISALVVKLDVFSDKEKRELVKGTTGSKISEE